MRTGVLMIAVFFVISLCFFLLLAKRVLKSTPKSASLP
jgi:hypothetical protein